MDSGSIKTSYRFLPDCIYWNPISIRRKKFNLNISTKTSWLPASLFNYTGRLKFIKRSKNYVFMQDDNLNVFKYLKESITLPESGIIEGVFQYRPYGYRTLRFVPVLLNLKLI